MAELRNLVSGAVLRQQLQDDPRPRTTISFYKYHPIEDVAAFRDRLYIDLGELGVLGRIYVANEGINAQISVLSANLERLREYLYSISFLRGLRLNIALQDDGKSFWVLTVRIRPRIVADGIEDPTFSVKQTGKYLNATDFNEIAEQPDTVLVDMRNYYEYEVGHFDGAVEVPSDTFREQLPMALEILKDERDKNIVMYCTGGIRCEKASAYLMHHGFPNVYHLEGGIIEYVRQAREQGLPIKFRGKNFVFDDRLGEKISDDILGSCHQCGQPCDTHQNCANIHCHLLFLQCTDCAARYDGCCGELCQEIHKMPAEEQQALPLEKRRPSANFGNSLAARRVRAFDLGK